MAASVSSGDEDGELSDINVTPLVDVVLVLLIVFMITAPAVVGSAPIDVNLPQPGAVAATAELSPMTVFIRPGAEGRLSLTINDEPTNKDRLVAMINRLDVDPAEIPITVQAGEGLSYGDVVGVMDMLNSIGLRKLALDTQNVGQ
jgi:biopolymer transport protein TolR